MNLNKLVCLCVCVRIYTHTHTHVSMYMLVCIRVYLLSTIQEICSSLIYMKANGTKTKIWVNCVKWVVVARSVGLRSGGFSAQALERSRGKCQDTSSLFIYVTFTSRVSIEISLAILQKSNHSRILIIRWLAVEVLSEEVPKVH